jgi:hypothetical protein
MSDATKLPADQQEAAMRSISADGLPQAIERQAAAGERAHAAAQARSGRRPQARGRVRSNTPAAARQHTDPLWGRGQALTAPLSSPAPHAPRRRRGGI